jgi:hypothetical protein
MFGEISLPSLFMGAGAVCALYCGYLVVTHAVPAAWAWAKSKMSAGTTEIATLRNDLTGAVTNLHGVVNTLHSRVTAVETDVAGLKGGAPAPAAAPAARAAPAAPATQP